MTVYALWHGGVNYSHSDHWCPQHFNYVHKTAVDTLTPNADEGAYIDIYYTDPNHDDNGIARRFEIGPRGGISES